MGILMGSDIEKIKESLESKLSEIQKSIRNDGVAENISNMEHGFYNYNTKIAEQAIATLQNDLKNIGFGTRCEVVNFFTAFDYPWFVLTIVLQKNKDSGYSEYVSVFYAIYMCFESEVSEHYRNAMFFNRNALFLGYINEKVSYAIHYCSGRTNRNYEGRLYYTTNNTIYRSPKGTTESPVLFTAIKEFTMEYNKDRRYYFHPDNTGNVDLIILALDKSSSTVTTLEEGINVYYNFIESINIGTGNELYPTSMSFNLTLGSDLTEMSTVGGTAVYTYFITGYIGENGSIGIPFILEGVHNSSYSNGKWLLGLSVGAIRVTNSGIFSIDVVDNLQPMLDLTNALYGNRLKSGITGTYLAQTPFYCAVYNAAGQLAIYLDCLKASTGSTDTVTAVIRTTGNPNSNPRYNISVVPDMGSSITTITSYYKKKPNAEDVEGIGSISSTSSYNNTYYQTMMIITPAYPMGSTLNHHQISTFFVPALSGDGNNQSSQKNSLIKSTLNSKEMIYKYDIVKLYNQKTGYRTFSVTTESIVYTDAKEIIQIPTMMTAKPLTHISREDSYVLTMGGGSGFYVEVMGFYIASECSFLSIVPLMDK